MRRIFSAMLAFGLASLPVAALAGGGGHGGGCPEQTRTAGGSRVSIQQLCFKPGTLTVAPGTQVTFMNYDEMAHTVTSVDGQGALDLNFDQGEFTIVRLTKPGIYRYYCQFHPGMVGAIRVGSSNALGSKAGVQTVKAGRDWNAVGRDVAPSPVNLAPPVAAPKSSSKAGFGLLGIIPVGALIWFGARRLRNHGTA